jgi:hypothetical protein
MGAKVQKKSLCTDKFDKRTLLHRNQGDGIAIASGSHLID